MVIEVQLVLVEVVVEAQLQLTVQLEPVKI